MFENVNREWLEERCSNVNYFSWELKGEDVNAPLATLGTFPWPVVCSVGKENVNRDFTEL